MSLISKMLLSRPLPLAMSLSSQRPFAAAAASQPFKTPTAGQAPPSPSVANHSLHFKIERYWSAAMLPLFPAAYFVHGPVMDAALSVALVLHIHWGTMAVVQDYARPIAIGDSLAKLAPKGVYVITALLIAGLLHFNYNDVGLTKAFGMLFSL